MKQRSGGQAVPLSDVKQGCKGGRPVARRLGVHALDPGKFPINRSPQIIRANAVDELFDLATLEFQYLECPDIQVIGVILPSSFCHTLPVMPPIATTHPLAICQAVQPPHAPRR